MPLTMINIEKRINYLWYICVKRSGRCRKEEIKTTFLMWDESFSADTLPQLIFRNKFFFSVSLLKLVLLVLSTEQLKLHRLTGSFRKSFRWMNNIVVDCLFIHLKHYLFGQIRKLAWNFFFWFVYVNSTAKANFNCRFISYIDWIHRKFTLSNR